MSVTVRETDFDEIEPFWQRRRSETEVQIVRDSILPRRLADSYVLELRGRPVGFAGVWREHFPGRVMDLYLDPTAEASPGACLRALVERTGADRIEAQSNMPAMWTLLQRFGRGDLVVEHHLFEAATVIAAEPAPGSPPEPPAIEVRRRRPEDGDGDGGWIVTESGDPVGWGGWLGHYNPPFVDVFMEVRSDRRGRGFGRVLVREICRRAAAAGHVAAARCAADNAASRATLASAGMTECGILAVRRLPGREAWSDSTP